MENHCGTPVAIHKNNADAAIIKQSSSISVTIHEKGEKNEEDNNVHHLRGGCNRVFHERVRNDGRWPDPVRSDAAYV
jgi:hypothetical protein